MITPKQYAQSLYESFQENKGQEKQIVNNFIKILIKNKDFKLISKIEKELEKIIDKKENRLRVKIFSAQKLDKDIFEKIKLQIAKTLEKKKIIAENRVDKEILGGVIIKYEDRVADGSLRSNLIRLRKKILS